jgi:hypothetical protein
MQFSNQAAVSSDDWLVTISSSAEARFNKGAMVSRRLNRHHDRVMAERNPGALNINRVPSQQSDEPSDWGVAEVVVFDRTLNAEEMTVLEEYLGGRLNFGAPRSGREGWADSPIEMASAPDMCMTVHGESKSNGGNVNMWKCQNGANQAWTYMPDTKQLRDKNSGKCLDLSGGNQANGTNLQIWTCDPSNNNQRWEAAGDGSFKKPGTDKCVDVSGGSTSNGANVQLWDCHGGAAQRFQTP